MTRKISPHEINFWKALQAAGAKWASAAELAEKATIAPRTARAFATRYEKEGIVERLRVFPAHLYRLSPAAQTHQHTLLMEQAAKALSEH